MRVVPWGMDPARFPWPAPEPALRSRIRGLRAAMTMLFMAAVAGESIKGFHVAHEACRLLAPARDRLRAGRHLRPAGAGIDEFTRSVGWCSQEELPAPLPEADILPGADDRPGRLSRTSVEAMASGIPVIASRIGGLPYTVSDGVTGLLFEPGDPADLARKIARLLDDPDLRRRMGLAGRERFEEDFMWETVIDRHWRPLLSRKAVSVGGRVSDCD